MLQHAGFWLHAQCAPEGSRAMRILAQARFPYGFRCSQPGVWSLDSAVRSGVADGYSESPFYSLGFAKLAGAWFFRLPPQAPELCAVGPLKDPRCYGMHSDWVSTVLPFLVSFAHPRLQFGSSWISPAGKSQEEWIFLPSSFLSRTELRLRTDTLFLLGPILGKQIFLEFGSAHAW